VILRASLLIAALAGCAGDAWAQSDVKTGPPLSKTEARQLPSRAVIKRATDQLSDVLVEGPRARPRNPPVMPLSDLGFWTRVRALSTPGLCAADQVTFAFEPTTLDTKGASTPARVSGVTARTHYRFLAPPRSADPEPLTAAQRLTAQDACGRLHPEVTYDFFVAPSEIDATRGAWMLSKLIASARDGTLSAPISCNPSGPDKGVDCRKLIARMSPEMLTSVEDCGPDNAAASNGNTCLSLWTRDSQMHVYMDQAFVPQHLSLTQYVVMIEGRID
jgi:hypothetical protein